MSKDLSSSSSTLTKSRKQVSKTLATGQKITLSPQDDRTLKVIYDYLAGYSKRKLVESLIEVKKREVEQAKSEIPPGAKVLMKERGNALYNNAFPSSSGNQENGDTTQTKSVDPAKIEGEKKVDEYYKIREQLLKLEERLKIYLQTDHKISFKDLDSVVRSLGKVLHRRQIEVRICHNIYILLLQISSKLSI